MDEHFNEMAASFDEFKELRGLVHASLRQVDQTGTRSPSVGRSRAAEGHERSEQAIRFASAKNWWLVALAMFMSNRWSCSLRRIGIDPGAVRRASDLLEIRGLISAATSEGAVRL